jgi:cobalt-precorrin-5B (C1)-methyltransferase
VARLTLAGGFAKMAKLAAGHLDLHSSKSQVDPGMLTGMLAACGADVTTMAGAAECDSAGALLDAAGAWRGALAEGVARRAREVALATLSGATAVEVAIVDRGGDFLARAGG